ncbi:hypothetical protein GF362_01980 [Candidatus Dojkabacteria bacterium]|nr:hypothetical protein [Candidatus Dojkabacteria bacterium]
METDPSYQIFLDPTLPTFPGIDSSLYKNIGKVTLTGNSPYGHNSPTPCRECSSYCGNLTHRPSVLIQPHLEKGNDGYNRIYEGQLPVCGGCPVAEFSQGKLFVAPEDVSLTDPQLDHWRKEGIINCNMKIDNRNG